MHDEGPHTPTLPFISQGATREKADEEKDRDTHQGGGREKVRATEKGEQRKGKRATKPRTRQGVASSRARDARREGGTAGTRHTAGTTPHQSTGEGSTRGTREKQHRAPRHAPHRRHTHRTHPHPRPQHVASEPRQPAQRAGGGGGGAPDARRPSQRRTATPPGTPYRHPHGAQRRPQGRARWGRCWVPTPAPTAPGTHGSRNPGCPIQRTGGRGRDSA